MNISRMKTFVFAVLIASFSLVCASLAAGDLVERPDLMGKFPGRVFVYKGEVGQVTQSPMCTTPDDALSKPWLRHPSGSNGSFRDAFTFRRNSGPSITQNAGSKRLKVLGRALDEGGRAAFTAAYANYCYVGTSATMSTYDVTDPKAPVLIHEITGPGASLQTHGSLLAGANGCQGELVLYDITDPSTPTEISRLSPPKNFYYTSLSMNDSVVVVMGSGYPDGFNYSGLVQVVDITDPYTPVVRTTIISTRIFYREVLVQGNILYLSIQDQGIAIFDISDSIQIVQLGFWSNLSQSIDGMAYDDGYLFCSGNGLEVVDVSDPAHPVLVAQLGNAWTMDIEFSNDIVYIVDDDDYSLRVIDVSDPTDPQLVTTLEAYGSVWDLDLLGDKIYLPDYVYGLLVVDISDPSLPTLESMTATGVRPRAADVEGDLAVVTSNLAFVHTLDVSDPFAPVELGVYEPLPDTKPNNTPSLFGLDLKDGYAAISDNNWGFHLYDVTDPSLPDLEAEEKIGKAYNPIVQKDNLIFTGSYQLVAYDISDPENPVLAGSGPDYPEGMYDMEIHGDTCYISCYSTEIGIVDISNPASMVELSRFTVKPEIQNYIGGIAVDGDVLGVYKEVFFNPSTWFTLELYDISDKSKPILISATYFPPEVLTLGAWPGSTNMVADNGMFFACSWDNMVAIDASDPMNPEVTAVHADPSCMTATWAAYEGVCFKDGLIYLAGHHGLEIIRYLDVGVFLTPSSTPVAVKQGESLHYELKVENFTKEPQTVYAWVDAVFPGANDKPLAEPVWVTVQPGENVIHLRGLEVPLTAPLGTYHLNAHVSTFPDVERDSDRITFEVVAGD